MNGYVFFGGKLVAKYASPRNPMEDSLKNERLEPKNHRVEKENHLNQIAKPTYKNCSGSSRCESSRVYRFPCI